MRHAPRRPDVEGQAILRTAGARQAERLRALQADLDRLEDRRDRKRRLRRFPPQVADGWSRIGDPEERAGVALEVAAHHAGLDLDAQLVGLVASRARDVHDDDGRHRSGDPDAHARMVHL